MFCLEFRTRNLQKIHLELVKSKMIHKVIQTDHLDFHVWVVDPVNDKPKMVQRVCCDQSVEALQSDNLASVFSGTFEVEQV